MMPIANPSKPKNAKHYMQHIHAIAFFVTTLAITGCTTVNVAQMQVMAPRQEIKELNINVDKNSFNEGGEAVALENGLKRHFSLNGYRLAESGHSLNARIVNLSRGSKIANTLVGLGVGKDAIEIEVKLINKSNDTLISFNVIGEVIDKRYAEVREMLADSLPEEIVGRIKTWGGVKQ